MHITAQQIAGLAPNSSADKNGQDLVKKNKFSGLSVDAEKTLLWGECAGSGKSPYECSADFLHEENPVFRCTCPSRQFPCKHCIGLLYAYADGAPFSTSDIPDELAQKRLRLVQREAKSTEQKQTLKEKAQKPKTASAASVVKKTEAQLAGLENAARLLEDMVYAGLAALDAKERQSIQARIKELGNYHISGVQTAFNDLLLALENVQNEAYTPVIDQLTYISALLKKASAYLEARKADPMAPPEIDSQIEEQIGYVWKLTDLVALGLYEENAELVQLSFTSSDNPARREFVSMGCWLNLKNGKLYTTKLYRPYKASKHIKDGDSFMDVAHIQELYIYPGGMNPRIRWESESLSRRERTGEDLKAIHGHAATDYAALLKRVKAEIKNPLADKNPLALLALTRAFCNNDHLVVEDAHGTPLTLRDLSVQSIATTAMLQRVLPAECTGMSLLVMLDNNVADGLFTAQPMTLVTPDSLVRFFY